MTPENLAHLHARCFIAPAPWNAAAFESFLTQDTVFMVEHSAGFLLAQNVLDQAEILTLAVDPDCRRQGIAASLIAEFHQSCLKRAVSKVFLEVAADNAAAIALYRVNGYDEVGLRKRYYSHPDGRHIDALVKEKRL